jgi:hypothetical protein
MRIESAIITANITVDFLRLEPTAWLQRGKGLLSNLSLKCRPAAGGSSCMDVIKLLFEVPWVGPKIGGRRQLARRLHCIRKCSEMHLRILDEKVNIGRNLCWLDRG